MAAPLPEGLPSIEAGIAGAREGKKPACLFFYDDGERCKLFAEKILGDKAVSEVLGSVSFVKIKFDKKDPECKKWFVRSAPTFIIVDCRKDKPRKLKTVKGGSPAALRKAINSAVKTTSK